MRRSICALLADLFLVAEILEARQKQTQAANGKV
jgi:hypothetical protein